MVLFRKYVKEVKITIGEGVLLCSRFCVVNLSVSFEESAMGVEGMKCSMCEASVGIGHS